GRGFAFGAEKGIDLWEEHLARAYEVPSANPSIALLHCCIAALQAYKVHSGRMLWGSVKRSLPPTTT
ncbi:hypothetical protein, partial [Stutzerimonas kunmingensis]|uniref:hypothetical protein n=1 Tax=Stutzerimonas kunmingensis TaxID=1211807 RepID=UPI00241D2DCB